MTSLEKFSAQKHNNFFIVITSFTVLFGCYLFSLKIGVITHVVPVAYYFVSVKSMQRGDRRIFQIVWWRF